MKMEIEELFWELNAGPIMTHGFILHPGLLMKVASQRLSCFCWTEQAVKLLVVSTVPILSCGDGE